MLEIGPTGSLTITGAESITNGAIKLDGGTATLDDTNVNGLTIGSGAILEGAGTVEGPINATSGTIAANYNEGYGGVGGTLDLQGKVTAGTLELYGWSSNTLKFDAAGNTAISVIDPSGNGDYGTLEIGAGGGLTLTDALNTTTNATIKLDGAGATFTDAAGIYLANSPVAISGDGVVNASITASGQYGGEIKESGGGTLDLNGALIYTGTGPGGAQLQTGSLATDVLALGPTSPGTATSDTAIYAQVNGLGTLDIDAGVTLTAQWINVGAGNLDLLGAGAQVNLTQSIELSGGDVYGTGGVSSSTGITGYGTYTAALDGGSVEAIGTAPGEVLTVGVDGGQIDATTATAFSIGDLYSNSDLALKGVVGTATVNPTITFTTGSHWGTLDLTGEGSGSTFTSNFHGVISGFTGADGPTSDAIDVMSSGSAGDILVWTQNGASGTLEVENASGTQVLETLTLDGTYYQNQFNLAYNSSTSADVITYAACYCAGTLIATANGEVAVENLKIGDSVVTASGARRKIVWIGTRAYSARFAANNPDLLPIRFRAGSLDVGVPRRDLLVSPEHAMFLDSVLISAKHLVNGVTIVQEKPENDIHYFHIELENHDVLIAEGAFSESFVDDDSRGMFHNAHEFRKLYPEARPKEIVYCAPRVEDGFALDRVRRRLAERAGLDYPEATDFGALFGEVERCDHEGVSGWARNAAFPDAPVCLDVLVDGAFAGYAYAEGERPQGGRGFAFRLAAPLDPSRPHEIELRRSADGAFFRNRMFLAAGAVTAVNRPFAPKGPAPCATRFRGSAALRPERRSSTARSRS